MKLPCKTTLTHDYGENNEAKKHVLKILIRGREGEGEEEGRKKGRGKERRKGKNEKEKKGKKAFSCFCPLVVSMYAICVVCVC